MAKNKTKNKVQEKQLTIVGIGASAGGLNALKTFFSHLPENTGLAYVVVVHLSPDQKSVLAELLQPHVSMPVMQVTQTVSLEPNHVYVIPPNANLNTIDTHLRLSELEEKRHERAPIDHFFRTLAATHDGSSVGVILSGTGSDGTLGLQTIKEKGGLTIVQDPREAEFDGMPQSAISTGQVDRVLYLREIPDYMLNFIRTRPQLKGLLPGEDSDEEERHLMHKVYAQVRGRTGRDFSRYKLSTIMRRLQRRMQIYQVEELPEYLKILRSDPEEVRALSDEFLINVTDFFRDPAVFEHLKTKVIPDIFDRHQPDDQLRIWSVGCASGEEAYSLAMLLVEEASRREDNPSMQIFASDLHEASLSKAREGFYPGDISANLSSERLRRFFLKEDGGYRVRKELREMIIFTPHNLLSDPPFSKIDLIVCRNLLIYLKREVQRDVFELFHYALRPQGYLLLGTSEHLESTDLFRTHNKELSIYLKRNVTGPEPRLPVFPQIQRRFSQENLEHKEQQSLSYGTLHQKMVERFAPPSLLLSPDYQVVHVSERAGRYLTIGGGELSRDAFQLIRPELRMELRSVIYTARERKMMVRSNPVEIKLDGTLRQLIVSARVEDEPRKENLTLVFFEEFEEPLPDQQAADEENRSEISSSRVKELEHDLSETRQRLQAIIEEYETSREEMKASNEELQSANEELRSTMEELETSKEELQSMNEELTTLNQENRHKVEELGQLNDDLQNLLTATDIATLFLDRELRILRFTPKLGELFNVRPVDRGRPISDQTHRLGYDALVEDAAQVLKSLVPIEKEVRDKEGHYYFTRLLPYRSADDRIEGVVITFLDISSRRNMENELRESREHLTIALEAARMGVWNIDLETRLTETTLRHSQIFGYMEKQQKWSVDKSKDHMLPEDLDKFDDAFRQALHSGVLDVEFRVLWQDGSIHWVHDRGHTFYDEEGRPKRMIGVSVETTGKKLVTESARISGSYLRMIFERQSVGLCLLKPHFDAKSRPVDYEVEEANQAYSRLTGVQVEEGNKHSALFPERTAWTKLYQKALQTQRIAKMEEQTQGSRRLEMEAVPLNLEGQPLIAVLLRDMSQEESDT